MRWSIFDSGSLMGVVLKKKKVDWTESVILQKQKLLLSYKKGMSPFPYSTPT